MVAYILPIEKPEKYVKIYIRRYNPEFDEGPVIKTYDIPFVSTMTVMQALEYLWDQGEYMAFRSNCREFTCGSCAILINNEPKLACMTLLEDNMVLEPLSIFPVSRDLVVDQNKLIKKYEKLRLWPDYNRKCTEDFQVSQETIKRYENIYSRCVECYCCLESCPSLAVDWDSYAGPMLMVQLGRLDDHPLDEVDRVRMTVASGLFNCTTCMKCEEVCPLDLSCPRDVIENFREKAVERGEGILQGHLNVVKKIEETGKYVSPEGTPFLEEISEKIEPRKTIDTVGFFVGCLADLNFQGSAKALVNVLKRNRVTLLIPRDQVCCGSPLIRMGQTKIAEEMVLKNVEIFKKKNAQRIITLCAHCAYTIKKDWPNIYKKKTGKELNMEVMDVSEYLIKAVNIDKKGLKSLEKEVTYHDPCYLNRGLGISGEPRELIKRIPKLKLVEMEKADRCCGGGGEVKDGVPEVAEAIGLTKMELIRNTEVDMVITACPHCVKQLREISSKREDKYEICSLVELLDRSYQGGL